MNHQNIKALKNLPGALAGVQHGESHNLIAFVANNNVILGDLAVGGEAGLLVVHVSVLASWSSDSHTDPSEAAASGILESRFRPSLSCPLV
jgi:hypothetical protein